MAFKDILIMEGRILVVDDSRLIVERVTEILKEAGYYVKTATSGADAVKLVNDEFFDIVYTDMVMPGFYGHHLCEAVKLISPNTEVVLASGEAKAISNHVMRFLRSGGKDEFLRKPVLKKELLELTEKILRKKEFK